MRRSDSFESWKLQEAAAEKMISLIGRLYREHNIVTSVYGRPIINRSVIDIIKAHQFGYQLESDHITVNDTLPILKLLIQYNLSPARIDIGKLLIQHRHNNGGSLDQYLRSVLKDVIDQPKSESPQKGQDVVLYGFGRIGRLLARILIERAGSGQGLNLKAIVVRPSTVENDIEKRTNLLGRDSVHGSFQGTLTIDHKRNIIIANGVSIQVIYADAPNTINYQDYGIKNAIVIDNTGCWRDEKELSMHLECPGVSRVLLTAPGKDTIKNVVYGVNHDVVEDTDRIISAASCTTNAITPVLKTLHDQYGVASGHMETVHAYTNDQNLIDNYHKKERRGRAAALNMVISETGAAQAVAKALPELKGKLTGSSIRVPTPNVSLAILNLHLEKTVTVDSLNAHLREMSLYSKLQKQIAFVNSSEVVSSDFVGSRYAGTVDAKATQASGKNCVLYIWYDNEFGYSCQVNRILQQMAGIMYPAYPERV